MTMSSKNVVLISHVLEGKMNLVCDILGKEGIAQARRRISLRKGLFSIWNPVVPFLRGHDQRKITPLPFPLLFLDISEPLDDLSNLDN